MTLHLLLGLLLQTAQAGGPWVPRKGVMSTYVGVSHQSFKTFVDGSGNTSELPDPINETGLAILSGFGLHPRIGLDLSIPVKHVYANGLDNTTALGSIGASGKFRLVDEGSGAPITISALAGLRTGAAHAGARGRLTNAGDGTTDFGGGLSLGRYSLWMQGPWWVHATAKYWYRLPHEMTDAGKVPGDDISFDTEVALSVHPFVGLGLSSTGFFRTGGQDLVPTGLSDRDNVWAALDADQVLAGAKVFVFLENHRTIVLGALRTVYAKNNPTDTLIVFGGFSTHINLKK